MPTTPGTVSKILWHFTGGPNWHDATKCQEDHPKPAEDAYKALVGILDSRELRLGRYKELVTVRTSFVKRFDPESGCLVFDCTGDKVIESAPVCCLADIPIIHLGYHATRYGTMAIGFHRESAIKHAFNPVLYTLDRSPLLQSIYQSYVASDASLGHELAKTLDSLDREFRDLKCDQGHPLECNLLQMLFPGAVDTVDIAAKAIVTANKELAKLLAFVKTFDAKDFGSIYCEREWRSTKAMNFEYQDVAMIVLPKKAAGVNYFEWYIESDLRKIDMLRTVPVVPWEDLVEH